MIIKLLDKLLGVEQHQNETVESIKREIDQSQRETVESIMKMNKLIASRNVTFDIHIATGGQGSKS